MQSITGEMTQRLELRVPQDTKDALAERGLEAPDVVVLELRESSIREKERFQALEKEGAFTGEPARACDTVAGLLVRRMVNPDLEVMRELVRDMSDQVMTSLVTAYLTGEMPDPKAVAQVVRQTRTGLLNQLMGTMAASEPFSAPSTASNPGTSADSPPASTES